MPQLRSRRMVLVLDNLDSFVWNIVHVAGEAAPGMRLEVVRSDRITVEDAVAMRPSHLIVSPGPCGPGEAGASVEIIRALAGRVPVLGICLGHQCIADAFGMAVVRGARPVHGKTSRVRHDGKGVLRDVSSPVEVMRYHSLVVDLATVDRTAWDVSAWVDEPQGPVVMGLRRRWARAALEGVQFHPESFATRDGARMLANFLAPEKQTCEPIGKAERPVVVRSRRTSIGRP